MQTAIASDIAVELRVLSGLVAHVVSGEYLEVDDTFEYEEGGTKITAMPIQRDSVEYLFTIEETASSLTLAMRSTRMPELFIALPCPLVIKFGVAQVMGDLC